MQAHRQANGETCPGYLEKPHATGPDNPLTADHYWPRSDFGDTGPLRVLCRRCNSRRHNIAIADITVENYTTR